MAIGLISWIAAASDSSGLTEDLADVFGENGTSRLRASDRKNYTVPAMVDQLKAIKAYRDLAKDRRKRRYKLTRRQQNILSCFGVSEADIDERIASIRD